jgi:ATP-binding cassette subfamily B protein
VTALVGPSGGGKSTIAKLAARFWDIDGGKVMLGGVDISKIDPEVLLGHYAIVFQDVTLFNSSIMENIRLGKKDASDSQVIAAARLAQCDEFVEKLAGGYDSLIGENGEKLSGGERQRISIARAILKDAPIILLDEATASLDAENESKIQQALGELVRNKTVLIIAHRMRTVLGADQIIVVKDGEIVETGRPEVLRQEGGIFSTMLEAQFESHINMSKLKGDRKI